MTEQAQRVNLFYTEGSSDKEYRAEIRAEGDGWIVLGFNGRRGQALKEQRKTKDPVDFVTAKSVYDKLVNEKTKKGYTSEESGAIYQSLPTDRAFSGFVPQLLNSIRDDASEFIDDDAYCAQEKHDGERRPIRVTPVSCQGVNKEGLESPLPMSVVETLQSLKKDFLVDGEIIGDRFVAFDLLEWDGEDLRTRPYKERVDLLENNLCSITHVGGVEVVETAFSRADKQALFDNLKAHNGEGLVFKKTDSHYAPGRPASGGSQRKFKFYEDACVRVSKINATKRSVFMECVDEEGNAVALGKVSIPPNYDIPKAGDLVTVQYLYLYDGGSLFQSVYKGVRTDQSTPDRLDQFKLKNTQAYRSSFTI